MIQFVVFFILNFNFSGFRSERFLYRRDNLSVNLVFFYYVTEFFLVFYFRWKFKMSTPSITLWNNYYLFQSFIFVPKISSGPYLMTLFSPSRTSSTSIWKRFLNVALRRSSSRLENSKFIFAVKLNWKRVSEIGFKFSSNSNNGRVLMISLIRSDINSVSSFLPSKSISSAPCSNKSLKNYYQHTVFGSLRRRLFWKLMSVLKRRCKIYYFSNFILNTQTISSAFLSSPFSI